MEWGWRSGLGKLEKADWTRPGRDRLVGAEGEKFLIRPRSRQG